jgi:SAGA-associated factor 73
LEDEDEANAGPIDEDEETQAVMSALASWRPKPLIPQPIFVPIKRQYQLARLKEQLDMATNGGRTNIFAVQPVKATATTISENTLALIDGEDAPGEPDSAVGGFAPPSRSASISASSVAPQRRPSVASRG